MIVHVGTFSPAGGPPHAPQARQHREIVLHANREGLLVGLAPFVKTVCHDKAAMAAFPGVAEGGFGIDAIARALNVE